MWTVVITRNSRPETVIPFNTHAVAVSYFMTQLKEASKLVQLDDFMDESNIHVSIGPDEHEDYIVCSLIKADNPWS